MAALRKREETARDTMAFHFDKPAGFEFKPGPSVDLTLIDPARSITRPVVPTNILVQIEMIDLIDCPC
jgi:hypothetical protein